MSKPILDAARHDLDDTMRQAVKAKLDKYDEVVPAYNKALLSTIVVLIADNATSFKYATLKALRQVADKAKVAFLAKAHGDKDGNATAICSLPAGLITLLTTFTEMGAVDVGDISDAPGECLGC
jgi:hypothetical protein